MIIFKNEIKQGRRPLLIWSAAIAFMLFICIIIFPEMKSQMAEMNEMMANMGSFTEAFGMQQADFGTLIGFYAVECGNILGIGGSFYAAFVGISSLAKEEGGRTAEFLLTNPVSRKQIIFEKLLAVLTQIIILNAIIIAVSFLTAIIIGEEFNIKLFLLLHLANIILQIEIAAACFGISAFLKRNSVGLGLGFAAILYFLNIVGNLTDKLEFVKYITPFKYAESSGIMENSRLDALLLLIGFIYTIIAIALAFYKYSRKDICA